MSDDDISSKNSNDIEVPAEQMNDFFFMDADEEEEKYGASSKIPEALSGGIMKEAKEHKVS